MPRALWDLDDPFVLSDLADASTEAVKAIDVYATELETDALPKARGSFRLGPEVFVEKLRLDEGIDVPLDKLIDIAERELSETQEAFRRTASRIKDGDPLETWQALKADHPAAGQVVAEARGQVQALRAFVEREGFVSVPEHDPIHIGPTPPFCRWTFASIWCPGPFEPKGVRANYYLTEVEPGWTPERQEQHLRDFNRPTLGAISMHEVYPGHYLHFQHLRQINSKLRKSLMTMPMSVVEGWAHYAEHLAIESGFDLYGPATKLGQLAETLVRLARLVVAIRLHTEDWSVEQGVRFFREAAFLEEGSARKEAERGTFDPGYGVYALGKLILMKLRKDVEAQQGQRFCAEGLPRQRARARRPALSAAAGSASRPGGRRASGVAWSNVHAPLRVRVRSGERPPLRDHPEVLGRNPEGLPDLRRPGPPADFLARDPVQGIRLLHHRLRQEVGERRREGIEGLADVLVVERFELQFQPRPARRRPPRAARPPRRTEPPATCRRASPSWPGRP